MLNPWPQLVDRWCILTQTNPRFTCFKTFGSGIREESDRNSFFKNLVALNSHIIQQNREQGKTSKAQEAQHLESDFTGL